MKQLNNQPNLRSFPFKNMNSQGLFGATALKDEKHAKHTEFTNGQATNQGRILYAKSTLENDLLSSLESDTLIELFPFIERVNFAGNQHIFCCDDQISSVYFPESCVISEFQILEDGRTVEIAMIGRESGIGLPSIFDHQPALNWSQITLPGTALKINIEILRDKISGKPALQKYFFKSLHEYLRQVSQGVVCHSYHSIEQRFCAWLGMLQDRKPDGKLSITQETIARTLGVQRPTITNIAHSLRVNEIIDYRRGQIVILDRTKLDYLSCLCNKSTMYN